ncbi:MAG: VTT domain-containing protein [Gemmatimonadota bacterium]|nr:VTT domain-containing protein [Gemmatimonadota bacterium]
MAEALSRRRFGGPLSDGLLRVTAGLGLASIPLVLLVPASGPLVGFALVTMWTHGPFAPFMPAAYEPVLMLFGTQYPPMFVAVVGALSDLCVEWLDYGLFRAIALRGLPARIREHDAYLRALHWFRRWPFVTVFVTALTPLPDWVVRLIAPAAGYSVPKYLVAMGLGRVPNFWFYATMGSQLDVPGWVFLAVIPVSLLLLALPFLRRRRKAAPAGSDKPSLAVAVSP